MHIDIVMQWNFCFMSGNIRIDLYHGIKVSI
jgi:hypothetical protein